MPFSTKEEIKAYNKAYYQANKCEHNRQKHKCKECGGSGICKHSRQKNFCKECGGSQICEHGRQKTDCKECGGIRFCEHNRRKSICKECGGSQICEHGRRKSRCKECGGSSLCEHSVEKNHCKKCISINEYLVLLQRKRLNQILKLTNITKTKPSIEYLSCSGEYFKEYIEKKMIDGMMWDNIHLDHIKPISKFNLENMDDLLDCCHYSNFQPLLACDNMSKGSKWNECDELFWNENIKGKEYMELYIPN